MNYREFIEIVPGKRSGKPCIKGTRITVADILGWLASGMSQEEIIQDYPRLTNNDINASLSYAADRERHVSVIAG
jgi:uncharacterized protein (DUF433 family)